MDTQKKHAGAWKKAAIKGRSEIIWQSEERLRQSEWPYKSEHKAYMHLVVAIDALIDAFIRLDESLKK